MNPSNNVSVEPRGVLLNYQLTKSLSLHGKSGDSQSIHLNYEIDLSRA